MLAADGRVVWVRDSASLVREPASRRACAACTWTSPSASGWRRCWPARSACWRRSPAASRCRSSWRRCVAAVESQGDGRLCSVLLVEGDRLRSGAAPRLPRDYVAALDGLPIGPHGRLLRHRRLPPRARVRGGRRDRSAAGSRTAHWRSATGCARAGRSPSGRRRAAAGDLRRVLPDAAPARGRRPAGDRSDGAAGRHRHRARAGRGGVARERAALPHARDQHPRRGVAGRSGRQHRLRQPQRREGRRLHGRGALPRRARPAGSAASTPTTCRWCAATSRRCSRAGRLASTSSTACAIAMAAGSGCTTGQWRPTRDTTRPTCTASTRTSRTASRPRRSARCC